MKNTFLLFGLAALLVACLCGALYAQEDIKSISDPAFGVWKRGAVSFMHDQHNAKAKLTDCKACHHLYTKGKLDPNGDSVGSKCSECHNPQGSANGMPLMRAYHRQCENCHSAKGAGPVACGECHGEKAAHK